MGDTPDKSRPWIVRYCKVEGCEFAHAAEWTWMRHERANPGHEIDRDPNGEQARWFDNLAGVGTVEHPAARRPLRPI